MVDCIVRDIQNSQCLLNVEYSGASCPLVTIQFGDTKDDVGLNLVKEGLVMVDVRKEKHLQKMVSEEMGYTVGGGGKAVLDKAISKSSVQLWKVLKLNWGLMCIGLLCCFSSVYRVQA